MEYHDSSDRRAEQFALGLGWFSIALGVAELAAARSIARVIGVPPDDRNTAALRSLGAREIAHGVSVLAQPYNPAWAWSRVAGDLIDITYLGSAMTSEHADRRRVAGAAMAVLGVTALDVLCARQLSRTAPDTRRRSCSEHVEHAVTVNRPIEEVYRFWRQLENLPRFMSHLESVEIISDRRSRWRAKGPAGTSFQWEAELLEEKENERISWRSVEGSDVLTSGAVRFNRAPGVRGTEVRVELHYSPPGGATGRRLAWLFGEEPDQQVRDDLRRFKQIVETGEVVLSDGPALWRPAQPPTSPEEIRTATGVQQ
jgi:uncharacterized membrane protein